MSKFGLRPVDGLLIGTSFPEEALRYVFSYEPRPDDVFIVTYPKCGTTWMQHIVYHIFSNGQPWPSYQEFSSRTPFFELKGAAAVDGLVRPATIKTHLPFHKQPYSEEAKYIYVARNPFDCCVSYFYHTKLFPEYQFQDGSFSDFLDCFLDGEVEFGDYFDHLLSWYPHRHDPNVLFLTYEELKKDVRSCIQKTADFLGEGYGRNLREDPAVLERIVWEASLERMKEVVNPEVRKWPELYKQEELPQWARLVLQGAGDAAKADITGDFVRKGQVGDWKSHFSPDQARRLREVIARKTKGCDVMELWKDLDLMDTQVQGSPGARV